jgi:serine/threonine-protein kinase RsbW
VELEKTLTLTIPNEVERVPEARLFVRGFLMDIEATDDDVFEILVAVEEAATNALRHNPKAPGEGLIEIRCAYMPSEFIVQVSDDGPGFAYDAKLSQQTPDPFAAGGRGLFLMGRLMDRVYVEPSEHGTSITMTRHLNGVDDAPPDTTRDRTYEHERVGTGSEASGSEGDIDLR